jgi:L-threonylcarbamoyladenylate synthase
MRTIAVDRRRVSKRALAEAAAALRRGGIVVFPTETAYGIAADPKDASAVAAVFAAKGRPEKKPLPLVAASLEDAAAACRLSGEARALAKRHWPGPLTIVLPLKKGSRIRSTGPGRTVAVRVPRSAWARAIASAAGGLATSTSANRSGGPPAYDVGSAVRGFERKPDLVLDAGRLPPRPPSTIVHIKNGRVEILRQGAVKIRP